MFSFADKILLRNSPDVSFGQAVNLRFKFCHNIDS